MKDRVQTNLSLYARVKIPLFPDSRFRKFLRPAPMQKAWISEYFLGEQVYRVNPVWNAQSSLRLKKRYQDGL
jgi:hypothetical protein